MIEALIGLALGAIILVLSFSDVFHRRATVKLKFRKTHPLAKDPHYATPGSAAFDIYAAYEEKTVSHGREFNTGLEFEVPEGHVLLLFSRSGHGFKHDIRLANCVGVIDSDYRGECMVKLTSDAPSGEFLIDPMESKGAIAQGMIVKLPSVKFVETHSELSKTQRGEGGFGSTSPDATAVIGRTVPAPPTPPQPPAVQISTEDFREPLPDRPQRNS